MNLFSPLGREYFSRLVNRAPLQSWQRRTERCGRSIVIRSPRWLSPSPSNNGRNTWSFFERWTSFRHSTRVVGWLKVDWRIWPMRFGLDTTTPIRSSSNKAIPTLTKCSSSKMVQWKWHARKRMETCVSWRRWAWDNVSANWLYWRTSLVTPQWPQWKNVVWRHWMPIRLKIFSESNWKRNWKNSWRKNMLRGHPMRHRRSGNNKESFFSFALFCRYIHLVVENPSTSMSEEYRQRWERQISIIDISMCCSQTRTRFGDGEESCANHRECLVSASWPANVSSFETCRLCCWTCSLQRYPPTLVASRSRTAAWSQYECQSQIPVTIPRKSLSFSSRRLLASAATNFHRSSTLKSTSGISTVLFRSMSTGKPWSTPIWT